MRKQVATDERKKRAKKILAALAELYPDADCALRHSDPLQLLIATILSAQSTDETVNKVTPVLFAKYPTAMAMAEAPSAEIEKIVYSTGFFRQKTKSVQGACRKIVEEFGGRVPQTMEQLVALPGVARKTANVVLGTGFGKNEGIVVDTHVIRVAFRLGWTKSKNPEKIEEDMMKIIPREDWARVTWLLKDYGRAVCKAPVPECSRCALDPHCPKAGGTKST